MCSTYEGVLYCLRMLDAHIDKALLMTAGTIAYRKENSNKIPSMTAVRCFHTDPATGFKEYFVVSGSKKNRGCWYSEEKVDLHALIEHRVEQKRPRVEKKEQQVSGAGTKRKLPPTSTYSMPSPNRLSPNRSNNADMMAELESEFQETVDRHRDETRRLLKASAARGEASVPLNKIEEARSKSMSVMNAANLLLCEFVGHMRCRLSEVELTALMAKAEADAVQLYIEDLKRLTESRAKAKSSNRDGMLWRS